MAAKVSISLPEELFRRFEAKRNARGLPRSVAAQRALARWTDDVRTVPWDDEFVDAYREKPQDEAEAEAWLRAEVETWASPARRPRPRRRK